MRTFRGTDGQDWIAWVSTAGNAGRLLGVPDAWLAFQNADDSERRRLLEVPADWELLPDSRLDLLRRMATPVTLYVHRHSPPGGVELKAIGPEMDD